MRKYHEGYALPFVLVVITVLCLVVASILPASLRTLNSQQASIQRMQAKYEAQGEIEKVVAKIENSFTEMSELEKSATYLNLELDDENSIRSKILDMIKTGLTDLPEDAWSCSWDSFSCKVSLSVAKEKMVQIDCVIVLKNVIKQEGTSYKIAVPNIVYESYTISVMATEKVVD